MTQHSLKNAAVLIRGADSAIVLYLQAVCMLLIMNKESNSTCNGIIVAAISITK